MRKINTVMEQNMLLQIGRKLKEAESVFILPHIQMDGDAFGSAVALCRGLRGIGKKSYILLEDEIPKYLKFLGTECCTANPKIFDGAYVCVTVDVSDLSRVEKRKEVFWGATLRICMDHHVTTAEFADYNYIDPEAAATGEIIFDLLKVMEVPIDAQMADAVFTAITTDTGNFKYSNTSKHTHLIAAELYDFGLNHTDVCIEIYENVTMQRVRLNAKAIEDMEVFCQGQANLTGVTQEMLTLCEATFEDTEGIIDALRSIENVEVSALLKEKAPGEIKVGLRAKHKADVASVAQKFSGGGHKKAAGCTIFASMAEAKQMIMEAVTEELKRGR